MNVIGLCVVGHLLFDHLTIGQLMWPDSGDESWLSQGRALCRIKLLPVTHVLVDTWMLTVKLVYKLSSVPDDLKWATNTHMTPFTLTFKA